MSPHRPTSAEGVFKTTLILEFGWYNRPVEPRDRLSRSFALWSILYEENMAKKAISSTDLIWLFHERLREFHDFPQSGLSIAIVPAPDVGWTVLIDPKQQTKHPVCARRVRAIRKRFREMYALKR